RCSHSTRCATAKTPPKPCRASALKAKNRSLAEDGRAGAAEGWVMSETPASYLTAQYAACTLPRSRSPTARARGCYHHRRVVGKQTIEEERAMTTLLAQGRFGYEVGGEWGKLADDWELKDVAAVAVDSKDRVYVFNRGAHPMVVFDRDGNFLRSWGEGLFTRAHGVHIGP